MTDAPNEATLWARIIVEELAAGGLEAVCIAPGSRSTPLTVAFVQHDEIEVFSHLDERSAAFFALGRGRRTGEPTALVCTSGTAAANFHPAVIEANQARVPLLVLTADRPPELRDSGANQTVDQVKLYGDSVRWYAELPEPRAQRRRVRSLRTTAARALAETRGTPAGPVHLNCPFQKPLEPTEASETVPNSVEDTVAGDGRNGAFVETARGRMGPSTEDCRTIARQLETANRPLIVAGPADPVGYSGGDSPGVDPVPVRRLSRAVDAPVLADPLSGCRFGSQFRASDTNSPICGGYDTYVSKLPTPDTVFRFGASPTSKPLRQYLADSSARQFLVDPAGEWREATFTATDLIAAEPEAVIDAVLDELEVSRGRETTAEDWLEEFETAERTHWRVHEQTIADAKSEADHGPLEGSILSAVFSEAPDPASIFVSNSMPIRDADRFGKPRPAELTVLANRGASGIDGITSTALGVGSATDDPLVLVTGDLAFYHDSNGLLAVDRCDVDATIVVLDNDGGGIFHMLPIEEFDPPFTGQFKTPHGLEFDSLADLYDLEFETVDPAAFPERYRESVRSDGTQVLHVEFDAEASHQRREALAERVRSRL
ncbi:2-succinyl-5-enolpyruvyl-6-hydroxy-3-cyclohexene-1-carboxylic-acid synthase [Halostagnicola sp. A-GB9-2]|uniref:2-succinyl-5-enolpyruvyl-6-hydroxy-3- cyclohexene-1-carboxylic-acid synthase n=1 Tax=Halostagnicola sp. A-GB9-2 TaxID=3048066 RepID=UPI0024C09657|nr:2-succinyl-5-enolpyruvyl-6-hydroxy-3-cyclohexene-1-carboxylic-acid synthase [Halostagnicola sp. A-GB9-2]MDJ1433369.1 2-succinyl-5-enolpyruvyl-6-hydroxy-3-cyclohexene-1-carboxylic-acid synthase [Halostagnicola sp. A-GB9-2]